MVVALTVLVALILAVLYAMIRANRDDLWRLLPGALVPLVLQIAVAFMAAQWLSNDPYAALGAAYASLFICPPTLTINAFLCLRKQPLGAARVLAEGLAVALLVPAVVYLLAGLFGGF